ncbi:MAG: TrmB family transcriptional regulator, partial [Candidatus Bathyarchaeia archaeon]
KLERRGLVEVQRGRPMRFRAASPSKALRKLESQLRGALQKKFLERKASLEEGFEQRMEEVSKAKETALRELESILEKASRVEPSEDVVWTITGAENIVDQMKDFIRDGRKDVQLMLPQDEFGRVREEIASIASKGVRVTAITHRVTHEARQITEYARVYHGKFSPSRFGIILVDGERAMFISENYGVGFKTMSRSMVTVLSHFFEHEMDESIPL